MNKIDSSIFHALLLRENMFFLLFALLILRLVNTPVRKLRSQ